MSREIHTKLKKKPSKPELAKTSNVKRGTYVNPHEKA